MKKLMAMVAGLVLGSACVANAYSVSYVMVAYGHLGTTNPDPSGTYSTYTGRLSETSTEDKVGGLKFPDSMWSFLYVGNASYKFGVSSSGKVFSQIIFDATEIVLKSANTKGKLRLVINLTETSRDEATATMKFTGSWMVLSGTYDCAGWVGGGSASATATYGWASAGKNPDWFDFGMLSTWNNYVPGFILTGNLSIPDELPVD